MNWDDEGTKELAKSLAQALGVPFEQIEAHVFAQKEKAKQRLARHQARWAAALNSMTDVQTVLVDRAECEGHRLVKFIIDRRSGHVAAMLQKERVWDTMKERMGTKLLMVYPDGSRTTTMEKSISIKKSF